MHCLWSNGIVGHALWDWLCEAKERSLIRFSHLDQWVNAEWSVPFAARKHFSIRRNLFCKKREKASDRKDGIKMHASDALTIYPLVRRFAEKYGMTDDLAPYTQTLLALFDVADVLQQGKRQQYICRRTMAKLIKDLVLRYMKARFVTYGGDDTVPKHHCSMHLWSQFLEDGFLVDCWVLERMHLLLKEYAEDICNTRDFEGCVIRRAVVQRTRQLQHVGFSDELIGPCKLGYSKALKTGAGQRFHVDDLVFPSGDHNKCYLVRACFMDDKVGGLLLSRASHNVAFVRASSRLHVAACDNSC